jgi:purine nucleosidase
MKIPLVCIAGALLMFADSVFAIEKRAVIIDADPGQDDAIALLFALGSNQLDILGITTVAGNVPLDLTSKNARIILDWSNRKGIPVYAGAQKPLVRDLVTAEDVHGKTGLDGVTLHEPPGKLAPGHAVDFIIRTLRQNPPGTITIGLLGPATNLALAMTKAPDIKSRIKEIVMMGGGRFYPGNITPVAEFNVYVDPDAANIVFQSGVPIVVLPLDVTHTALTTPDRVQKLRDIGNLNGDRIADILTSYSRHDMEKFGLEGGPLHDPCVIGYLLNPSLFDGKQVNVMVETKSDLTLGQTVVDWNAVTDRKPNALWITKVKADEFYALLTDTLSQLP